MKAAERADSLKFTYALPAPRSQHEHFFVNVM